MTQPASILGGGAPAPAPAAPAVPAASAVVQPVQPVPTANGWSTDGLSAEHSQLLLGKGWKGLPDVLTSYQHAEKVLSTSADRVLKLPTAPEDPAWNDVWTKLGRPEKPESYDFGERPATEGVDLVTPFREAAHRLGVPQGMARGIVDWFDQTMTETAKAMEAQEQAARQSFDQQRDAAITKQLGAARAESELCAQAACVRFGIDEALATSLIDGLARGPDPEKAVASAVRFFEVMARIGAAMGEHKTAAGAGGGSPGAFEGSPEHARAEIARLEGDKAFMAAYHKGEPWAVSRRTALFKQAYPAGT